MNLNEIDVTIFDVTLSTNEIHNVYKINLGRAVTNIDNLLYTEDDPDNDVKKAYRTNVIFRGPDGKFISWKKLGPRADLSNIPAFPPKP